MNGCVFRSRSRFILVLQPPIKNVTPCGNRGDPRAHAARLWERIAFSKLRWDHTRLVNVADEQCWATEVRTRNKALLANVSDTTSETASGNEWPCSSTDLTKYSAEHLFSTAHDFFVEDCRIHFHANLGGMGGGKRSGRTAMRGGDLQAECNQSTK